MVSYIVCIHVTKYHILVNDTISRIQTFFFLVFLMVGNVFKFWHDVKHIHFKLLYWIEGYLII